jgi:DNA-binding CsgD family transcriptional regulator
MLPARLVLDMGFLTASDDQLLDVLYSAAGEPERWHHFLGKVARRLDAAWVAFLSIDPSEHRHSIDSHFGVPEEATRLYAQHYGAIDPWFLGYQKRKTQGWIGRGTELCPRYEVENTEFHHDFLRPFDLIHECGMINEDPGGKLAVLTALRRPRQNEFAQKDVGFLKSLTPHLTRALLLHGKMMDLKRASAAAASVLDSIDVALLGLSGEGKLCFTNALADSILRTGEILCLEDDRLVVCDPRSAAAWQRSFNAAAHPKLHSGSALKPLTLDGDRHPFYVTLLPFCRSTDLLPGPVKVLVVITDPSVQPKSREQLLVDLFGLTPSEARVTMLLVSGLEPKEISEITEKTQNTVRFQLKVIYRKTGVSRQSQLVRLVSMLPGRA